MVYRIPQRQGEFVYSGDVYQALIPMNHFLRKVDAAIDFSFTNEECRSLYCPDNGRPTTNYPEKMLRAEFLQYYYDLSDREMEERASTIWRSGGSWGSEQWTRRLSSVH
jgi:hypothetical protein